VFWSSTGAVYLLVVCIRPGICPAGSYLYGSIDVRALGCAVIVVTPEVDFPAVAGVLEEAADAGRAVCVASTVNQSSVLAVRTKQAQGAKGK